MNFERISVNPDTMMGKPCIKGTRITVELILQKLSERYSYEDLPEAYPGPTINDIQKVFRYSFAVLTNESIIEDRVS